MCFPTKIVYGCGCVIFGGEFCYDSLNLANDPGVALLCGSGSLPLMEIRRVLPCYRLECPKQEPFEPWVCCNCEHGPNITSLQCKFKLYKEPVSTPDPEFISPCNHIKCDNCVSLAELEAAIAERAAKNARKKEKDGAAKGKGKVTAKAVPKKKAAKK